MERGQAAEARPRFRGSSVLALFLAAGSFVNAFVYVGLEGGCSSLPEFADYVFPATSGVLFAAATVLTRFFRPSWVRFPIAVIGGALVTFLVLLFGIGAYMNSCFS